MQSIQDNRLNIRIYNHVSGSDGCSRYRNYMTTAEKKNVALQDKNNFLAHRRGAHVTPAYHTTKDTCQDKRKAGKSTVYIEY